MLVKTLARCASVLSISFCFGFALPAAYASDDAPKPGDKTVAQVCSTCHGMGLMGAPKIGDTLAWQGRLKSAGSIDRLVESAEHGKGNMPARGGMSKLTDADLKSAITYMLAKSGADILMPD